MKTPLPLRLFLAFLLLGGLFLWLRPERHGAPVPAAKELRTTSPGPARLAASPAAPPPPPAAGGEARTIFQLAEPAASVVWPTPAPIAPIAPGKDSGRVATLAPQSFASLETLRRGDRLVLPLVGGRSAAALVELVQQERGTLRIAGKLADEAGTFFFSKTGSQVGGLIQRLGPRLAYRVEQGPAGELLLREMRRSDVVCAPLPRMRNEAPRPGDPAPAGPQPTIPILNSRPNNVVAQLYLDFDGETVTDPAWNGGATINAAAYSLSAAEITEIFERVREDFQPFNVNVTTDRARYNAAPIGRRMRCIITPTDTAAPGAGGVAYINSFSGAGSTFSDTVPCWVFNASVIGICEAISHEIGHTLGLLHDGRQLPTTGHEEYFTGHGAGPTSWCPIMGASYYVAVSQWSKGEYQFANNQQDDVAIIAGALNGFGYASDEAGNALAAAVPLNAPGGTVSQAGVITSAAESDFFAFTTTGGAVTINAAGAFPAPNLDIALEIQDANGVVQVAGNPANGLAASVSANLAAGTYFVKVSGSAAGDILTSGYSTYGSIGAYTLTGTVPGGGAGGAPNLTTVRPAGWSGPIVLSKVTGTSTDAIGFEATDTVYVDFAVLNNGSVATGAAFTTELYLDNVLVATFPTAPPLSPDARSEVTDYSLGTLSTGPHTLRVKVDAAGAIAEGDETDNEFTRTFSVGTNPNLAAYQPFNWTDRLVISNVTGTTADVNALTSANTLYLDFAVANFGNGAATPQFLMALYVDEVLAAVYQNTPPFNPLTYIFASDVNLGSLPDGVHTVRLHIDPLNAVAESDEGDNQFTKTFVVGNVAPANNPFASAQVITGSAGTVTGTNVNATKEPGEPNHGGDAGGGSVWFRWTAPGSGPVEIDTFTSNFDTLLAVYTGGPVNGLTLVPGASNDDDANSGTRQSRVAFTAVAGTTYHIAVDGWGGERGSITMHWTLDAIPELLSLTRANGSPTNAPTVNWTATFSVPVSGVTASNFSLAGSAATGAVIGTPTTANGGRAWNVPVTTGSAEGTLVLSLANITGLAPTITSPLPFVGESCTLDRTAPALNLPAPITVTATSPAGAVVGYTFAPTDANGIASSSALPASGSVFAAGTTTVNASATDLAGNVANGSFTVTVNPNPAPTGGSLSITPSANVYPGNSLVLSTSGWSDPDAPLSYQFFLGTTALHAAGSATTLHVTAPGAGTYTYKVVVTDSAGSTAEATQQLTVLPASAALLDWRQLHFGTTANSGTAANDADPDGDGRPNAEEFAFGTDPADPASGALALKFTGSFASAVFAQSGQPIAAAENPPGGPDERLLFVRRTDHATAGLSYLVEFSPDLSAWTAATAAPTVLASAGGYELVSVPFPAPVSGQPGRFGRVTIVLTP